VELQRNSDQMEELSKRAEQLREQIQKEQKRKHSIIIGLDEHFRSLQEDNEQLRGKLLTTHSQNIAHTSDATFVKRDIVTKTMELERALREFHQGQQDQLFSRIWDVTKAMNEACTRASGDVPRPSNGVAIAIPDEDQGCLPLSVEAQQALKRRLQSLGDVVVYASAKFEACSATGHPIPPGALRVRPRRCDHVFLVECLMPYWAEGVCPVCRCSFAFDHPHDTVAGSDDCDRCSSVSTSISQIASGAFARSAAALLSSGANLDGGCGSSAPVLPQPLSNHGGGGGGGRGGGGRAGEPRSAPAPRDKSPMSPPNHPRSTSSGPHRGTSRGAASSIGHALDGGQDVLRRGRASGSPSPPSRDRMLYISPSRSVASVLSHGSSGGQRHHTSGGRPL